ncbi:MAG TPA: type II secretion system F family protein [Candidatus Paceibacterota bacterium]
MRKTIAKIRKHLSRRRDHGAVSKNKADKTPLFLSFPVSEQILFAKRMGMILRSGTPILQGLELLNKHTTSRSVSHVYQTLSRHIAKGQSLSSGLGKFPRLFGEFAIHIVSVGETTGTLSDNLNYLAEDLKKKQTLKKKVMGALIYPVLIVVATTGIAVLLTVYIFPKITPIFKSFHTTLPLSTQMLIAISGFLIKDGLWMLFGIAVLIIFFLLLLRLKRFRYWYDRFLLSIPILGKIIRYYNVVNITRTLGLLLRSDVRVVEAFEIVAKSTKNPVFRKEMESAARHALRGQTVAYQFKESERIFPPMVAQMIAVGESTGNLSESLVFCAEMYEEEISDLTKNLTNMLEPVLMIVMGLIVGFVAISIITPIYGITQNLTPYR